MKKTYKIKNYKGNIVESLTKFQKKHPGVKIVEAVEDKEELKIKTTMSEASQADEELETGIEEFFWDSAASGEIYDTESEQRREIAELKDGTDADNKTVRLCKQYLKDECGIDVFRSEEAYDDFICDKLQELAKEYIRR